ncbi:MAG: SH3 domain-containing protein, partial [Phycisphaerae bacterium]|nr:SH3 domain-containing protein [Phycisphaerae bacterium]
EQRPAVLGQTDIAPADTNDIKYPYIGEVTGTEINVRSGPGMNFYSCGKISTPMQVVVVEQKYIWTKILPPPGSFSWIFKQYVQADANKPQVGIVSDDNVRVYAGSDDREPMRSDSVQITVSKGQKVRIIGQAIGDYYKIAPPQGACLWTSSQYIKFLRSADNLELKLPHIPATTVEEEIKPNVLIEQIEAKNRNIEIYYELEKQFEDEKTKPLIGQDYSKIKTELQKLVDANENGDAENYAKYLLKDIGRCELAAQASSQLQKQNEQLDKTLAEIEKDRQEKLGTLSDTSKYAVIGTLKTSLVYESRPLTKRFIIADANNVPLCFAEPVGQAGSLDLNSLADKKVGLIGKISRDDQSKMALVKFEKIEILEPQEQKEQQDPNKAPEISGK